MKRKPQQRRALDRIEAILAAAEAVVAEGGYDNLTMVNIAARAGITHNSIYPYFNSVEAILVTLVSRMYADFRSNVALIAERADSPDALIDALIESFEYGFQVYRNTPIARGLWAATRYLPTLRKLDDEDTVHNAGLLSKPFAVLAPDCDVNAVSVTLHMVVALAAPAYEAALSVRKSLRNAAIAGILEMVRWRLRAVVLAPRRHVREIDS
jgi:AcrR family transcriptional regulator